jgi:prepilin-type N-terminal cleavage/methylation domain-containing protein/prepilin-type processing-associated H-X9-DG protein
LRWWNGKGSSAVAPRRGCRAFTLIELLVVVAIIAMLASILVPSLVRGKAIAKSVVCLSNLRQFSLAAQLYASNQCGRYPIAYCFERSGDVRISHAWDFSTARDRATGQATVKPGLLWQGSGPPEIHQCPSFSGSANWIEDRYTGYNYNTSYIGHGQWESIPAPAKCIDVLRPSRTALFGDGQYGNGANKFMRAPWSNPGDAAFSGRSAGTQGFRHLRRTNVAFCDGHAASHGRRCVETYAFDQGNIAPGTGFLSEDNSLYDLQ